MKFNESMIYGKVPKIVIEMTRRGMEEYCLSLIDAFREAVREYPRLNHNSELYKAWYYDDYRRFIPSAYYPETLDFNRYPLQYDL